MKKIREDFINQYPPLNLMKVSNLDICFALYSNSYVYTYSFLY